MKKPADYLLRIYKNSLSLILEFLFGKGCRFSPTCSEYAATAINKHGFIKGGKLTLKRVAKCHPYSKAPYSDPVPLEL